jgi:hypothetical protein
MAPNDYTDGVAPELIVIPCGARNPSWSSVVPVTSLSPRPCGRMLGPR